MNVLEMLEANEDYYSIMGPFLVNILLDHSLS